MTLGYPTAVYRVFRKLLEVRTIAAISPRALPLSCQDITFLNNVNDAVTMTAILGRCLSRTQILVVCLRRLATNLSSKGQQVATV